MERINNIKPADLTARKAAEERWNSIAKPLGSLGLLEEAVIKIAGIQCTPEVDISKRTVIVMCSDNGVVCEGVTQSDSVVTAVCAEAIADGRSNINKIAECYKAEVLAVDIGINRDIKNANLLNRKIAYGTRNICAGAAMSPKQAEKAIVTGMDIVSKLKNSGTKIIVTGEMGIGNTTTSAALSSVILGVEPELVTGKGAGLTSEGLKRKISAVKRAISQNSPDPKNNIELLSKLGGFDIAGMVGVFLGGAFYHVPIIIDGVISAVAAVLACRINFLASEYMLASHISGEPAGKMLLENIGVKPIITAKMRLGEGTGGAMLLPLLDGALSVYNSAHRFDETPIERYEKLL